MASIDTAAENRSTSPDGIQKILDWLMIILLGSVPLSFLAEFLDWGATPIFVFAALSLIPLAKFMGGATEELAVLAGPTIGGLMNATFGNTAELIIALIALRSGLVEVVKASITGSMISNLLLVAGLAMLLGGLKFKEQTFQPVVARVNASAMNLAVVALLLPTVVATTAPNLDEITIKQLSTAVAIVLMVVYGLTLVFSLRTHSYLYAIGEQEKEKGAAEITEETETEQPNLWLALGLLVGIAVLVAVESELLVGQLENVLEQLPITELFLGVIILPIIGNAAEHATAVTVAIKDKMELSLAVAIGSTLQIALFVGPVLVLVGDLIRQPMDFQFGLVELVAVGVSVLLVNSVSSDGRSNWLEGLLLLATYAILALAFFYLPAEVGMGVGLAQ